MNTLLVFGYVRLPREAVRERLTLVFRLQFATEDSLYLGGFDTAQTAGGELWRLHQNFNVLENAWLEDAARDCGVLLYIGGLVDALRLQELRHRILSAFPTARELCLEADASATAAPVGAKTPPGVFHPSRFPI